MDAYFASVEMRDNPALRNIPMAVGSVSMIVSESGLKSNIYFMFSPPPTTMRESLASDRRCQDL